MGKSSSTCPCFNCHHTGKLRYATFAHGTQILRIALGEAFGSRYDPAMSGRSSAHRKRLKHFNEPGHAHELTFSCHGRLKLLASDRTRQWFIDALSKARDKWHLELWAYVIMPEHAHVLLLPTDDVYDMADVLKTIKQSVSRRAMAYLRQHNSAWMKRLRVTRPDGKVEHRFWLQGGGYDRNVYKPSAAWRTVEYIHENPVRRGLVDRSTDWKWSSARQYAGLNDILLPMDARPPDPSP